jgi:hypothetical protein
MLDELHLVDVARAVREDLVCYHTNNEHRTRELTSQRIILADPGNAIYP